MFSHQQLRELGETTDHRVGTERRAARVGFAKPQGAGIAGKKNRPASRLRGGVHIVKHIITKVGCVTGGDTGLPNELGEQQWRWLRPALFEGPDLWVDAPVGETAAGEGLQSERCIELSVGYDSYGDLGAAQLIEDRYQTRHGPYRIGRKLVVQREVREEGLVAGGAVVGKHGIPYLQDVHFGHVDTHRRAGAVAVGNGFMEASLKLYRCHGKRKSRDHRGKGGFAAFTSGGCADVSRGGTEKGAIHIQSQAANVVENRRTIGIVGYGGLDRRRIIADLPHHLLSEPRIEHVYSDTTKSGMQDQATVLQRTFNLLERTVILGFGTLVVLALMFVAGNYQDFADQTQLRILWTLQALSGITSVSAAAAVLLVVLEVVRNRRWRLIWRILGFLVIAAVSVSLALGSTGLLVILQPL